MEHDAGYLAQVEDARFYPATPLRQRVIVTVAARCAWQWQQRPVGRTPGLGFVSAESGSVAGGGLLACVGAAHAATRATLAHLVCSSKLSLRLQSAA